MRRKRILLIISILAFTLLVGWVIWRSLRPKADTYVSYTYTKVMTVYGKITPPTGTLATDFMVVANQNSVRVQSGGMYYLTLTPDTFQVGGKQQLTLPLEVVNASTFKHYLLKNATEQPSVYLPESWREGQVAVYSGRSVSSSSYLDLSQRIDVALK